MVVVDVVLDHDSGRGRRTCLRPGRMTDGTLDEIDPGCHCNLKCESSQKPDLDATKDDATEIRVTTASKSGRSAGGLFATMMMPPVK
jgi:hypothetical protein